MNFDTPSVTLEEQEEWYEKLSYISECIGIPKEINEENYHLLNDDRSRLIWYFVAEKIKSNPVLISSMQKEVDCWKKDTNVNPYFIEHWEHVLDKVREGQHECLYESSELMQELRSHAPLVDEIMIDGKLRWIIITYIGSLCKDE